MSMLVNNQTPPLSTTETSSKSNPQTGGTAAQERSSASEPKAKHSAGAQLSAVRDNVVLSRPAQDVEAETRLEGSTAAATEKVLSAEQAAALLNSSIKGILSRSSDSVQTQANQQAQAALRLLNGN